MNTVTIQEQKDMLIAAIGNLDTIEEMDSAIKTLSAIGSKEQAERARNVKNTAAKLYAYTLEALVKVHVNKAQVVF